MNPPTPAVVVIQALQIREIRGDLKQVLRLRCASLRMTDLDWMTGSYLYRFYLYM